MSLGMSPVGLVAVRIVGRVVVRHASGFRIVHAKGSVDIVVA
jgi:hypothetical protein